MEKLLLLLSFLLVSVFGYAQITFERTYGGSVNDYGSCVQQTSDSGYIITGGTLSYGAGSYDVYLIKTNKYGDTLWTKSYGGNGWDIGNFVKQTMDGGYIISGMTPSFGAGSRDVYLIKTNSIGDTLWTRTFGGTEDDEGGPVTENSDGSFIVVGKTLSFATGYSAAYIIKTDANGLLLWSRVYEKLSVSGAGDIQKTINGDYFVSGWTYNMGDNYNSMLYLLKIKNNGDTIWTKAVVNPNGGLSGARISLTNDNSIVFTGTLFYSNGTAKIYMMKTDSLGNVIWFKKYGGSEYVGGGNSFQTNDGGFILTGVTGTIAKSLNSSGINLESLSDSLHGKMFTNGDLYLLRTNSNGDSLWSRTYGGTGDDVGNSVQQTIDDGYIIAGYTNSFGNNNDIYLIKTDNNGHVVGIDNYETSKDIRINVYPNPTNGNVNIQIPQKFGQTKTLEVFDCIGQKQFEKTNGFTDIDISSLTSGLYFIALTNKDNERQTIKIIKE